MWRKQAPARRHSPSYRLAAVCRIQRMREHVSRPQEHAVCRAKTQTKMYDPPVQRAGRGIKGVIEVTENTITNDVTYLVENLAASWNGGSAVLDRLVAAEGGGHASPYAAIHRLGAEGLQRLFGEDEARAELTAAVQGLREYLA